MEVLSAILIDISSELNIIVPPQSKHAAIYIRIPLENIVASVLIPAESSPSQTEVALPIDLKSADKYTLLHNAGPRHESRILLGFESRKMAMQTQRVLKIMMQQASSDDNVIIYESIIDINNEGSEDAEDPLDYIPDSTGNDAAGAIQMSQVSASRKEIAPVVEEEKLQSQSQRLNSPQRPRSILQSYIASGNAKDNEAFRDWPVSKLMKPNDNDDDTETTDENGKGDGVELVAQKKTEDGTTEAEKHLRIEGSTSTHDIDASRNPNARPNVTQQPSSKDIQGKQDANKDPPAQRQVNPTNQPSKLLIPATDTAAKIPKLSSKSALASSGVKMPGLPTPKQTKMPSLIDAAKVHNICREESMLDELADEQMLQVRRSPPLHTEGPKRPLASKNTASNKLSVQETLQPSKSVRKESDLLWDEGLIPEDYQLEKQPKASNRKGNQSKKRSSKGDAADKTMTTKPKGSRARPSQAASKPKKTASKPVPSPVRKVTRAVPKRNAATKANKQMEEQIGSEAMADVKALNQMSQEVHRVHPSVSPQSLVPNSNGDKAGERNDETPQQHFSRHSFPHSVDNDQNRSLEAAKLHNDNNDGRRVVQAMAHSALVHLGGSEVEEDGHEPIHADDQLSDCPKDIQPGRISSSDNHNDMKVHQATPEAVEESHPIIADSQVQAEPSDHKAEKKHTQKITKPNSRPVRNDGLEEDGDLPERRTNDRKVTLTDNGVKGTRPRALESPKPVLAAKSTNAEKKRIRFDSQQLKDRNKEWGTGKGVVARLQGNIPKTESRRPAETMSKHTVLSPKDAKASTNKDDEVEQPDAEIHKKETLSTTPPKKKSASALQQSAKKRPKEEHQKTARIMQKSDAIVEKTPNPDPNRKAAIIHFDTSGPRNQGRLSAKKPARPVKTSKQIRKLALPITQEPKQDLQKLSKELSKEPPRELPIELLKEISPASPFAGSQPPLEDGSADDYIPMAASTQSHSSHRIGTTPQRLQIAQVDQELDRGTANTGHNSQLNASKTLIPTQKEFTKTRHRDTAQEAEEFWNPQVDEVLQAKVLTQASTFIHSRSNSQPQVTEEGSPIHPSQVRSQVRTTMEITSSMPSSSPYSSSAGNPSHFFVDHEKPRDSADVPAPKSPINSTKSFLHVQKENAVPGETITERLIDQDPTDASKHKVEATKDIVRTPLSHRHQQTPKDSGSRREILQVLRQVSSHLAEQQKIATESKKKRRYASRPVTPAMDQDTTLIEQPASPRRKRQKQARFDSSNSSVSIVTPQRKAPAKPFDARMQPRPRSENKEQNKMVLTLIQICRVSLSCPSSKLS